MREQLRFWANILTAASKRWASSDPFVHAAALAFYTVFSMAPVMIITVSIVGVVFGESAAEGQIARQLEAAIGSDAAAMVQTAVVESRIEVSGILPTFIGVVALVIGATTMFAQLQSSLNGIWEVTARPSRSSIVILLKQRVLSLAMVVVIGFVMLVSLLLSVLLRALLVFAEEWLPAHGMIMLGFESTLSLLVITLLFAAVFRVLPDVQLGWRDVVPGALVTALLFILGRWVLANYLAYTATGSAYGAAGSLVLLLLWVNYSSLILLFGAAFTRAHREARGLPILPSSTAALLRKEVVEEPEQAP